MEEVLYFFLNHSESHAKTLQAKALENHVFFFFNPRNMVVFLHVFCPLFWL